MVAVESVERLHPYHRFQAYANSWYSRSKEWVHGGCMQLCCTCLSIWI